MDYRLGIIRAKIHPRAFNIQITSGFPILVNNQLIMRITHLPILLILLILSRSQLLISGFTLYLDTPQWFFQCQNLIFTHELDTSVCEKDTTLIVKTPYMIEPMIIDEEAHLSEIRLNDRGNKLFLKYNYTLNSTGNRNFYWLGQKVSGINFATNNLHYSVSFSENKEHFAYGTQNTTWTIYGWNNTAITQRTKFQVSENLVSLKISNDGITLVAARNTSTIQVYKYNTFNGYQLVKTITIQNPIVGIHDLECYFIDQDNIRLAYVAKSSVDSQSVYTLYVREIYLLNSTEQPSIFYQELPESMEIDPFSSAGNILGLIGSNQIAIYEYLNGEVFSLTFNHTQNNSFIYMPPTQHYEARMYFVQNSTHTIIRVGYQIFYRRDCHENACDCPLGYQWNQDYCEPGCTWYCPCETGLIWNQTAVKCQPLDCTKIQHTIVSDKVCECQIAFYWDEDLKKCMRNCTGDQGSTKITLSNNQCQCLNYYYWDSKTLRCKPHCFRTLAKGINPKNVLQCECHPPAIWNEEIKDCYLNCRNVTYSNGQHKSRQVCNCVSPTKWNHQTLSCEYTCEDISGAAVDPYDNDTCICHSEKHFWSKLKLKCFRKCWEDPNSDGRFFQNDTCSCNNGYQWDFNIKRCLAFSCKAVYRSTGLQIGSECECQKHFAWDRDLRACIIQCNTITNKNDFINQLSQRTSLHQCPCLQNSIWDTQELTCKRNCQLYSNSVANRNYTHCLCKLGFMWNQTSLTCQTNCGNKEGQLPQYDEVERHCVCEESHYWDSMFNSCYKDCNLDMNAISLDFNHPTQCICRQNFVWDSGEKACVLSCKGPFDLKPSFVSSNQCECEMNTKWYNTFFLCMVNCLEDPLSQTGVFDRINSQCQCTQDSEWDPIKNKCVCVDGTFFNSVDNSCKHSLSGSVVSIGVAGGIAILGPLAVAGFKLSKKQKGKKKGKGKKQRQKKLKQSNPQKPRAEQQKK